MNGTMAMPVNSPVMLPPQLYNPNVKDSRWLTLEVCREYTRNKCTRSDQECKFAHPPPHVEVQNGRVTCCFDSIKGKCQRKDPPCKYLHPPQHLKEQLLQNGRNNLILKNLHNLQMQAALAAGMVPGAVMPGTVPVVPQYLMQTQHASSFAPYMNNAGVGLVQDPSVPVSVSSATGSPHQIPVVPTATGSGMAQKVPRPDRLESSPVATASSGSTTWSGHPSHVSPSETVASSASQYNPIYFQSVNPMPGMVPIVKRAATIDGKSGIPVYQPTAGSTSAYQQALAAMQLQPQPYVPAVTIAGHPPGVPRF